MIRKADTCKKEKLTNSEPCYPLIINLEHIGVLTALLIRCAAVLQAEPPIGAFALLPRSHRPMRSSPANRKRHSAFGGLLFVSVALLQKQAFDAVSLHKKSTP